MEQVLKKEKQIQAKPIMKWAGGKTQMLGDIMPKIPQKYGKYIEPFIGGGALFFALSPDKAIIADSNPELINMYRQVADNVEIVVSYLKKYKNTKEDFYEVRSLDWLKLKKEEAAARTIYLNKTCFNGLYRVNKKGQFNVPFGKYKAPNFCDAEALYTASDVLKKATITCGDYLSVLKEYAEPGDFIFLDPPYLPISEYSDFKRYTKEQFYEEDHVELAKEVKRLQELGCHVILTNSNHPLVHELYADYKIEVIQTKRYISCNGSKRKGEDIIVDILPKQKTMLKIVPKPLPEQVMKYPATRYMGSKSKLLPQIWAVASQFNFDSVVDLFSGSGIVGYMFKAQGKTVISNDYMAMSATFTKAMVENNNVVLPLDEAKKLLIEKRESDHFVEETFRGLYYKDEENRLIDVLRTNIAAIRDQYKKAIAMTALIRACTKKRPRGIFTYTGDRYNDGRKDLQKSLEQQFLEAVESINNAIFDNGCENKSKHSDAMEVKIKHPDLVYIDPPYYSPLSDNEYVRRYHFVEGLARDWKGVEIQENTVTKKFKSYPTPFSTRKGAADAFDKLFKKFSDSILIVSYSSNSQPTQDEMVALMSKYKEHVEVVPIDYTYSFGNQKHAKTNRNKVQEYLFVGFNGEDVWKKKIDIWLVGNTGLRNPNRIQEGFKAFANSPYVGKLHGKENEIGFMKFLNDQGIIQNEAGKDTSGSHARKWRLMFSKNGFIYPQVKKKDGDQEELGQLDDITPFGRTFLKADTYPAVQECYLRALSVEQFAMPDGNSYFSPLRWMLAIMLELEKRTGSSEITRIEFALWGHTTNPSYSIDKVVDNILDLRVRRKKAPSKRNFDRKEVAERGKHYDKKADNFLDYSDMNMRYLRISGVLQRKGRGMIIVPAKHILAEKLAKSISNEESIMIQYERLCEGAELPTDNLDTAKALLDDLMKQMKGRHILFDISDLPLNTATEINIARKRLENLLSQTDEIQYAKEQCNQWQEIADYMELLIKGGGKRTYDDDNVIEVPKDETPAYLEWILWRASLAIDHMVNKPYEVRGFKLDSDFLPVSAAGGGKGDLYCEFNDFTILTEVTMSTSSRQEAMEGEPVRRHVSDAVLKYDKPVYGMFIAVRIDTNTAETFRHGIWYARGDVKQRLDIVPLTLAQYREYFMAMFRTGHVNPEKLRELILLCETRRDILNAPGWKAYIGNAVDEKIKRMEEKTTFD